jgi:hypothetical protein
LLAKPLRLRIRLRGFAAEPLVGMACRFDVDGTERPEQTDGDGFFERVIPATVQQARISFDDPTAPFHARLPLNVKVGQLDPVEERSGQAARLNNLGYDAGPLDPSPSVQDAANTGAGSTRTAASDDSSADVRTEDDPEFDGIVEDIDAPPPADADESSGDTASPVDLIALQFRSAVEEFQCDNQLTVDGKCGPNTQAKLKAVHGS